MPGRSMTRSLLWLIEPSSLIPQRSSGSLKLVSRPTASTSSGWLISSPPISFLKSGFLPSKCVNSAHSWPTVVAWSR
jgi:hypothetical protein